jgi:hypothetical protein
MRNHRFTWVVAILAMALVSVFILGYSPASENDGAGQAAAAEQVETSYTEVVGKQCRYGGRAVDQASNCEGVCELSDRVEGAGEPALSREHGTGTDCE